jgi:hypothetical protein
VNQRLVSSPKILYPTCSRNDLVSRLTNWQAHRFPTPDVQRMLCRISSKDPIGFLTGSESFPVRISTISSKDLCSISNLTRFDRSNASPSNRLCGCHTSALLFTGHLIPLSQNRPNDICTFSSIYGNLIASGNGVVVPCIPPLRLLVVSSPRQQGGGSKPGCRRRSPFSAGGEGVRGWGPYASFSPPRSSRVLPVL